MAITAKLLQKTTRPIQVGEIVLLPDPKLIALGGEEDKFRDIDLVKLTEKLLPEVPSLGDYLHLAANKWEEMRGQMLCAVLNELWEAYCQFKYVSQSDSIEPKFFYQLPKQMQVYLRFHFVLLREDRQYSYLRNIPFTGLTYVFLQNSLASYLYEEEKDFQRLWGLKQLANLLLPARMRRKIDSCDEIEDDRYAHSLDTGAITNPVTFNNARVLPWILRWATRLAGYVHDIATPAGGDGIKPLNPEALCEERNIEVVFRRKAWQEFFDEIGAPIQLIIDIVRNQDDYGLGILSSHLDRNAFIARDLSTLLRQLAPDALAKSAIYQCFLSHPEALTLWDSIRIIPTGKRFLTVFMDPQRLYGFLKLRVLMFRDWYYLPEARSKRTISSELVGGYLQSTGDLVLPELINMTDKALNQIISRYLGLAEDQDIPGDTATTTFSSFDDSLRMEKSLLKENGADLTITEICESKINPAIDEALILNSEGKIIPFGDAYPQEAGEIVGIATIKKPFYLHAIRNTGLNSTVLAQLREFRIRQIERMLNQT